jgi:putative endopeptidase
LYEKHVHLTKERAFVRQLFEKIKVVFRDRLEKSAWLQPATIQKALKKLDHLDILIGGTIYPKSPYHDPTHKDVLFDATDPIHNILAFVAWFSKVSKQRVAAPGEHLWDIEPDGINFFDVNAYYVETRNHILIPDGLLSPPFLDLRKSFAHNAARIGTILAHEISHAFDNHGYLYDEHGRLRPWWTEKDIKAYEKRMAEVNEQYKAAAKRDRLHTNIELSLGENLADITGFDVTEEVVLHYIRENGLERAPLLRTFYEEYARLWQSKTSVRHIQKKLDVDAHSFEKYRVNCVVARSPHFRELYGIKPGDGMYYEGSGGIL